MAMQQRFQRTLTSIFVLSLIAVISACGGGGGSSTPADTTPDAFMFTDVVNANPASVNTSAAITVAGINEAAAISITNGTYSINGGTYTAAAGTVSNGQTVTVKATASTSLSTAVNAVLTIGGVSDTYTVTTIADTAAPTVQVMFPPPVSLSSGTTLKVRGTASDALSTITSVTVGGVAAVTTDNYATWTADVPLTLGANSLDIAATDGLNNTKSDAAHISVQRVVSLTNAHTPDAMIPFVNSSVIALDSNNNRALVVDHSLEAIIAVDLLTGIRTIMSDATTPDANTPFSAPGDIVLDTANNRALVVEDLDDPTSDHDPIIAVDLTTGARTVLSDCTSSNSTAQLYSPEGLLLDTIRNRVLVSDYNYKAIIAVDLTSGVCTLMSGPAMPNTNVPLSDPIKMTLDSVNSRVLVADAETQSIIAVDVVSGARTLLSDNNTQVDSPFIQPVDIALDVARNRAVIVDSDARTIFSMDLASNIRTIISNSTIPNANNLLYSPYTVALDAVHNVSLTLDITYDSLYVIDIITGERVVISK